MSKRLISRLSVILLSSLMVVQSCQTPINTSSNIVDNKNFSIKAITCGNTIVNSSTLYTASVDLFYTGSWSILNPNPTAYVNQNNPDYSVSLYLRFNDTKTDILYDLIISRHNYSGGSSEKVSGSISKSSLEIGDTFTINNISGNIKSLSIPFTVEANYISVNGGSAQLSNYDGEMTISNIIFRLPLDSSCTYITPTPTPYPSSTPTILPTVVPTTTPTINPTITPTLEPTISPPFYGVGDLIPGQIPSPINYNPIWTGGDANNPCTSKNPDGSKGSFTIASAFDFHTKNSTPSGGPDITLVVVPTSNYPNPNKDIPNINITTPDITTPRSDLVHRKKPDNNDCLKYPNNSNEFKFCQNNIWSSYVSQDVSSASIQVSSDISKMNPKNYPLETIQNIISDLQKKGYKNVGSQIENNGKLAKDTNYVYTASLDLNGTTLPENSKVDISKLTQVGVDYPIKLKIGSPEQTVNINLKKVSESSSQGIKWSVSCGN